MKIINFILVVSVIIFLFHGCSVDEDNTYLISKDELIDNTWIRHSYSNDTTNGFNEYRYKDCYSFHEDGSYLVRGNRIINIQGEAYPVMDERHISGEWDFNENDKIIDFKINKTISFGKIAVIDTIFGADSFELEYVVNDMKIITMKQNEFIVTHVLYNDEDYEIVHVEKYKKFVSLTLTNPTSPDNAGGLAV